MDPAPARIINLPTPAAPGIRLHPTQGPAGRVDVRIQDLTGATIALSTPVQQPDVLTEELTEANIAASI